MPVFKEYLLLDKGEKITNDMQEKASTLVDHNPITIKELEKIAAAHQK